MEGIHILFPSPDKMNFAANAGMGGDQGEGKAWNIIGMKAGVYYYNLLSSGLNKSGKVVIY